MQQEGGADSRKLIRIVPQKADAGDAHDAEERSGATGAEGGVGSVDGVGDLQGHSGDPGAGTDDDEIVEGTV